MTHIPLPSIDALVAFESAARHQSFTRAGAELNRTQGAVDPKPVEGDQAIDDDYDHLYENLTGSSLRQCPICHQGRMIVVEVLTPGTPALIDTS